MGVGATEKVEGGVTPVIDFSQFYTFSHLEENEVGIVNMWEYYFEQPTFYGVNAARNAYHYIEGDADCNTTVQQMRDVLLTKKLQDYCDLYRKYVHLNSRLIKLFEEKYNKLVDTSWNMLGLPIRGTDYRNRVVIGENRQPGVYEIINKAKSLMIEWGMDHIFLTTEDARIVEVAQKELGDQVVFLEKYRYKPGTENTLNTE